MCPSGSAFRNAVLIGRWSKLARPDAPNLVSGRTSAGLGGAHRRAGAGVRSLWLPPNHGAATPRRLASEHERSREDLEAETVKVPKKRPKQGRLWLADGSCIRQRVEPRLDSENAFERLETLFDARGTPAFVRSDNSGAFTARAVREWLARANVKTLFIAPANPWANGYIESSSGVLREELLDREIFYTLGEANILIERWSQEYNNVRPRSALEYRPPAPQTMPCSPLTGLTSASEVRLT